MNDLEERLRTHATSVLLQVAPVTADEARGISTKARPSRARLLALAAELLALAGIGTVLTFDADRKRTHVTTAPSTFPMTLVGHRDWNVAVLNGEVRATDEELEARYSEDFVKAVSPAKFRSTSEQLIAMAPWRIISEVERRGEEVLAVQLASRGGEQVRLTLHRNSTGEVDGSTILAAVPCADPVATDVVLDGPLNDTLGWITELLETTMTPSDDELGQRFSPSFLSSVPPERFRALLPQLRNLGPYSLRSFEGPPSAFGLTARVGLRTGEEARLSLSIEPDQPHRVLAFSVLTQPPCRITANS